MSQVVLVFKRALVQVLPSWREGCPPGCQRLLAPTWPPGSWPPKVCWYSRWQWPTGNTPGGSPTLCRWRSCGWAASWWCVGNVSLEGSLHLRLLLTRKLLLCWECGKRSTEVLDMNLLLFLREFHILIFMGISNYLTAQIRRFNFSSIVNGLEYHNF